MRFTRINFVYCSLAAVLLHGSLNAFEPEIKLAGRKDLVLGVESRQTVLEVGVTYLASDTDDYMAQIENLKGPFAFKDNTLVTTVAADNPNAEETPEPEKVNYDDASVLAASAASFAKKVRGSIVRGESSYLQLEGGVLLRPGTSFPVRLPQAEDQTFTLTVTEITPEGYTLQIGEATKPLNFNNNSESNSVQFSNP